MEQDKDPTKLLRERSEAARLTRRGITFEADVPVMKRRPGLLGFLRPRRRATERREYRIPEPTLAVLDRLSALWVELDIDEAALSGEDPVKAARCMAAAQCRRMADIAATAVLGEEYYLTDAKGRRKEDRRALQRLSDTFYHALTPADLLTLALLITNACNLVDFTASMRLMSASRTTAPIADRME